MHFLGSFFRSVDLFEMPAIAPITGMLRKHLLTHLTFSLGAGVATGYAYWYGVHLPQVKLRDDYYLAAQKEKEAAA